MGRRLGPARCVGEVLRVATRLGVLRPRHDRCRQPLPVPFIFIICATAGLSQLGAIAILPSSIVWHYKVSHQDDTLLNLVPDAAARPALEKPLALSNTAGFAFATSSSSYPSCYLLHLHCLSELFIHPFFLTYVTVILYYSHRPRHCTEIQPERLNNFPSC